MSYPYGPPPGSRGGYGAPSRPPPIPPPHAYPTPPSSGPSYGHPPPMNPGGPPPAGNGYYPPPQPSNTNAYHSHLPGLPTFPPPPTQAYAQTRPPPSQQSYNESYASSLSYPSHSAAAPPSRDQYDSRQQQGVAALGGPTGGRGRGGGRGSAGRRMGSPEGRNRRPLGQRDYELEDRLARERKCRTLFVRNVAYEADLSKLRTSFEEHGEIKEFFDLVQKRGMVFITYFDMRAAERARDATHGIIIKNRPIDVHYSLPRPEEQNAKCDREKNQGSILATLHSQRHLDEYELRRAAEPFGEIRMVKPCRGPDQEIIEFFDSRGAALFVDRMDGQAFMGGTLELRFIWDELDTHLPPPPALSGDDIRGVGPPPSSSNPAGGYGAPASRDSRPPRRSGEGPGYGNVRGRRPERRTTFGEDDDHKGSYSSGLPPPANRYSEGPPAPLLPANRYGEAPPAPSGPATGRGDDRLEQARRVQELLASLGGSSSSAPSATPPAPSYPPPAQLPARPYAPPDPRQQGYRPPGPQPQHSPPQPQYQPYTPNAMSPPAPASGYYPNAPRPPSGAPGRPPPLPPTSMPPEVAGMLQRDGPPRAAPYGGQYRPPMLPSPNHGHALAQGPPQGQGQGQYGPQGQQGQGDVGSLLAMLKH